MNQYAAAKRQVDRLVRRAKDYPVERFLKREQGTIEDYSDYLRRGQARGAMSLVQSFSGVPTNLGPYHVLNGQEALGWTEVERAWYLMSLTHIGLGAERASETPCLLLHAIVRGSSDLASRLSELVRQRLGPPRPVDWQGVGLPEFALGLYSRWTETGDFADVSGPFAQIVASWSADGLESALNAVCDHHLDAAFDEESVGVEFPGYASLPIELLAIGVVREKEGLSMPKLEHPFANTPLAKMPLGPTGYDPTTDPWVARAFEASKAGGGLIPADLKI